MLFINIESETRVLDFKVENSTTVLTVFTTRIDTSFGVTYLSIAPESELATELTTAENKVTSVEMLKHYAEDAKKSQVEIDAIKEPKQEIVIQATGIYVIK